MTSAYQDLLSAIPLGPFYDPRGTVLPYSDAPYQFRLATPNPNTRYNITVNQHTAGAVTTDAFGIALVNASLDLGDNILSISNTSIGSILTSYITTRNWATWLAAIADVLGPLDDQATQMKLDRDLATVGFDRIDTVWGRRLHNNNSTGYQLDTYRELLQVLQRAYRRHSGRTAGLMEVIAAFTHVNPLIYRRGFGPTWNLGNQFAKMPTMDTWTRVVSGAVFPGMTAGGAGVTIDSSSQFRNEAGSNTLAYNATTHIFTWTTPSALVGTVQINPGDVQATIFTTPASTAALAWSELEQFNTLVNNNISLEIDGRGIVLITLTASGTLTAAAVAISINAALAADPRYGATYNTSATAITGRVQILSKGGTITLHPSNTADAANIIFGMPWSLGATSGPITPSGTAAFLLPITNIASFPIQDSGNTYFIVLGTNPRRVYQVKYTGQVVNNLTIYANGDIGLISSGTAVYVQGQIPYTWQPPTTNDARKLVLNLTNSALLSTASDTFVLTGSALPTGWWFATSPGTPIAAYVQRVGWMRNGNLQITNGAGGAWTMFSLLKSNILNYIGYPIDAGVWVARDYQDSASNTTVTFSISFDGGATFTQASKTLTPGQARIPIYVSVSTTIPATATSVQIGVAVGSGTVINSDLRIEKVTARVSVHTGRNLGRGTVPRNNHRSKRGYLCYVWAPAALVSTEKALLGLPQGAVGHVDTVAPTYVNTSRFEATEISGGTPLNVVGVLDSSTLAQGTTTNMQIVVRSPARFSYMKPSRVSSIVGEVLLLPTSGPPYIFTLSTATAQDLSKVVFYEGAVSVTHDQLVFTGPTTIQLLHAPLAGVQYTVDYEALIRYESVPIPLLGIPTDRTWFADVFHLLDLDFTPASVPVIKGIQFDSDFTAALDERSDQDQSTGTLTADDGRTQVPLDITSWDYVSSHTVRIDPTVFDPQSLYALTYNARVAHPVAKPTATLQFRQGVDATSCLAATYIPFTINQVVAPAAYVQFRITYGNVMNIESVRLYSAILKGLNTQGTGGIIPILRNKLWTPIPKDGVV